MAKAYGSITLVDIGDLGQLSVTPESNQPTTVIYDPDTEAFNPDWSNSSLKLTPVIYYGGQLLTVPTNGLTVTWQKKEGSGSVANITSGISNGVLTVSSIPFTPNDTTLITYIVSVDYTEPSSGTPLNAKGQITFGLIQNASKIKTMTITGESAFLYNSDGVVNASKITLTATAKNTEIGNWQYKNASGTFVNISNSAGKSTLDVTAESAYFNTGNIAVIRVLSDNDATLYDEHTIIKVRDGAPGDQVVSAVLSNDDQMIACDSSGTPTAASLAEAVTTITIYEGNTNVTSSWNIDAVATGCTGNWTTKPEYKVTALSADVAYVTFTCTKTNYTTITKKFSLTKIKTGANGTSPTIYTLSLNALALNKDTNGQYTPATLTMNAYSQTGSGAKQSYAGRFKIYLDNSTSAVSTSSSNESSRTYTPGTNAVSSNIKVELYAAGSTSGTPLDSQTVVITSDGQKGETGDNGAPGADALNFILGNYSDVIPCTNGGNTATASTITIPFTAYKGTTRLACSATYSTLPDGIIFGSNTAGTTTTDGKLVFNVASGKNLGGADTGTITITLTANSRTSNQTYTWTKNRQAAAGANAILFQIYAPDGNIIYDKKNQVELATTLVNGATTVTSNITYKWAQYENGTYNDMTTETASTHTVDPEDVNGYASYRCIATYGGKQYTAYFSVYDKDDPLQVTVYSTLGDKIINGQGQGLVYARVFRNGSEIDTMKTVDCGTSYPSGATSGDFYYYLDSTAKTATLKTYNGSTWVNAADSELDYTWYLRNQANETIKTVTGKAIYIDADVIDTKMTFDVEVSTKEA